jgi:DNA-binding FadR family transcriptional regulator
LGVGVKSSKQLNLHDRVVGEIGRRIVAGEFEPDCALPGEVELCATLGVSRTSLREAIRVLSAKGLVVAKQKVGTLVAPVERWKFLDSDVLIWWLTSRQSKEAIRELYELRHLIEPLAASLAARHASAADRQALRLAYEQMQAAGDDGAKIVGPDLDFHRAIIKASGNRLFSSLARAVAAALSVNFDWVRDAPRGHRHSMPLHSKVLEAIVDGNPSAARLAMQKLIEDSRYDAEEVNQALEHRPAKPPPKKATTGSLVDFQ